MQGLSFIIIEKEMNGVNVRPMKMGGVWSSGTGYVTFDNVKVPIENIIGKENDGFKLTMDNFNHERWMIAARSIKGARLCYEEAFKYAHQRKTFGKYLIESQVIRNKLANMIKIIESTQSWCEFLTFQAIKMNKRELNQKLGGTFGLLKVQSAQVMEFCIKESSQIFGGRSFQRGGLGGGIERGYRDLKIATIGGGTDDILLDLSVRIASKIYKSKL